MKFKCPHCNHEYDHPKAHPGQKAKCKQCHQVFSIPQPPIEIAPQPVTCTPEKITPDTIKRGIKSILFHTWARQPVAFRTGFITTLGVMSALMLTWYLYGSWLRYTSPAVLSSAAVNQTSQNAATKEAQPSQSHSISIETLAKSLHKIGLYHDGKEGFLFVFRGRNLYKFTYLPDANYDFPELCLYTNISGNVVGVSAMYRADDTGMPSGFDETNYWTKTQNEQIKLRNFCVCLGFKLCTSYSALGQTGFSVDPETNLNTCSTVIEPWTIIVAKIETFNDKTKYRSHTNKTFIYTLIAQNW
jgi:hypothetical protein